jgi:hypothetical protein
VTGEADIDGRILVGKWLTSEVEEFDAPEGLASFCNVAAAVRFRRRKRMNPIDTSSNSPPTTPPPPITAATADAVLFALLAGVLFELTSFLLGAATEGKFVGTMYTGMTVGELRNGAVVSAMGDIVGMNGAFVGATGASVHRRAALQGVGTRLDQGDFWMRQGISFFFRHTGR